MKHLKTKLFTCLLMAISLCLPIFFSTACDGSSSNGAASVSDFYDAVAESQICLDEIADETYSCWYDAIYNNKYSKDINIAIATARANNRENLNFIDENETKIQSLYKEVRDSELKDEVKAVMSAYSDYYEFVVNVSGSFNSFSANKETYKKALATALKNLAMEL